jgi:hypothetical protein
MARKEKQRLPPPVEAYYRVVWPVLRQWVRELKGRAPEMEAEAAHLERLSRRMTKLSWADGRPDAEVAAREFVEFAQSVMSHLEGLRERLCPRPKPGAQANPGAS